MDLKSSTASGKQNAAPGPTLPSPTLPKGGGALSPIGEKLVAHPQTGTAGYSVPIATSPGRSGFGPSLALTYDSGAGQGPFGIGWSVAQPSITRKTEHGLPRYGESDVFVFAGAEDLVPISTIGNVTRYRPRVDSDFARIEQHRHDDGTSHWVVFSRNNVRSVFGFSEGGRVYDPTDRRRIFRWLLEWSDDDRGNVIAYSYFAEEANRYIKTIGYGGATMRHDRAKQPELDPSTYPLVVLFDYGEHFRDTPRLTDNAAPFARLDPFSNYRSTFDVRTRRLCQRVLMLHKFGTVEHDVVRSTNLDYFNDPAGTRLRSVQAVGWMRRGTTYTHGWMPAISFTYSTAELSPKPISLDSTLPLGDHGQLIDLDGEGLPGFLRPVDRAWHYARPTRPDSPLQAKWTRPEILDTTPIASPKDGWQLVDQNGDGLAELVRVSPPIAGVFVAEDRGRTPLQRDHFVPFSELPPIDWDDPELRFTDLDGDGLPDVLIHSGGVFRWHRSRALDGYESEVRTPVPVGVPLFSTRSGAVLLADMTGDGLPDIVLIEPSSVSYWSNLGYGRFGPRTRMRNAPVLGDAADLAGERVILADLDGTGPADLLYLVGGSVLIARNLAGNGFADAATFASPFGAGAGNRVLVADLLGAGTSALVFTSRSPAQPAVAALQLLDQKPHLLRTIQNGFGATTTIDYATSTKFYLSDRASGRPWVTRLPFPVHVVERVTQADAIAATTYTTIYRYHHGFYDGVEREFRGFALVESEDSESIPDGLAPVLTKTWFHTGAFLDRERITRQLANEYFAADLPQLADTPLPTGLTPREARDALRALRGRPLRVETYALDGNPSPYTVIESSYALRREVEEALGRPAVFTVAPRETLSVQLERHVDDPRFAHQVATHVGPYGDVEETISIAYRRRENASTRDDQRRGWALHRKSSFKHFADEADDYRLSIPLAADAFELLGIDSLNPLSFEDVVGATQQPTGPWTVPTARTAGKRWLVDRSRLRYWNRDGTDAPDVRALLRSTLALALTEDAIAKTLVPRTGDVTSLLAGSGYIVDSDGYWAPSDEITYDADQFYLPVGARDPFGNKRSLAFELPHILLPAWAEDATKNRTTFTNDYRLLTPSAVTDQNGTVTSVETDELGIVRRTFIYGDLGKSGGQLLDIDYGFGDSPAAPTYVHVRTAQEFDGTSWEEGWVYSDGSGRTLQQKKRVEPDTDGKDRFASSGRTVFNNKGLAVKQYEPFFSTKAAFDLEESVATSRPIVTLHYDPLGRVVRTEQPDSTYSTVFFDAWRIETWDAIDTLDQSSTWATARADGKYPREPLLEQTARDNALKLAQTPSVEHLDAQGRAVASITDIGPALLDPKERYCETSVVLDFAGKAWKVIDPRGLPIAENVFDIGGRIIHTASPDSGAAWTLPDASGLPCAVWQGPLAASDAFRTRGEYDEGRRPVATWVQLEGSSSEILRERLLYSDGPSSAPNSAGRLVAQIDGGGIERVDYDFRGLPSRRLRYVRRDVSTELDATSLGTWEASDPVSSQFASDPLTSILTFDAMAREVSRETRVGTRHSGTVWRTYDVAGQLQKVTTKLPRRAVETSIIEGITYDAKGRRSVVTHAHGGTTSYEYDPTTFQLLRQTVTRAGITLQDLNYVCDPVGNIAAVRDGAQDTICFKNTIAPPIRQYEYDGLYRLVTANGREHASQSRPDERDVPAWVSLPYFDPNDGKQVAPYTETYEYDKSNNLQRLKHDGLRSWARTFSVAADSNRLNQTTTDGDDTPYSYTSLGQLRTMGHLAPLGWNHRGELIKAVRTLVGNTTKLADADSVSAPVSFAYDLDSRRVTKQTDAATHHYAGAFDLCRNADGSEIETLLIDDGGGRIAIVDTSIHTDEQAIRYQHNDHLGGAALELGEDGEPLTYEEYHPYGTTAVQLGDRPKRYRFTGQERDEETGLQYHHHRYYAPWLGRWASPDPKGLADGINRHGYCHASPIGTVDASGTQAASSNSTPIQLPPITVEGHVDRPPTLLGALFPAHLAGRVRPPTNAALADFPGLQRQQQLIYDDVVRANAKVTQGASIAALAAVGGPYAGFLAHVGAGVVPAKVWFAIGLAQVAQAKNDRDPNLLFGAIGMVASMEHLTGFAGTMVRGKVPSVPSGGGVTPATSLASPSLLRPVNRTINVGGGLEAGSSEMTNLNPIVEGTGGPTTGIPNHVRAGFEEIDSLFEAGSTDRLISSKLPANTVNWERSAEGAYKVMAPGGKVQMNVWTKTDEEVAQILEAFKKAGFQDVESFGSNAGIMIFATR